MAELQASGRPVTYQSVRELLCCRKIDLVPFMQTVLADARQKRAQSGGVARALSELRNAVAEDQSAFWNEQLGELREEVDELSAALASRDAALKSAEARIAELNVKLAAAQAEIMATRAATEKQTAPLLKMLATALRNQTERQAAPKIIPASKWTTL